MDDKKKFPIEIRIKRELASMIGITICSKCGTRTKFKPTEISPMSTTDTYWEGYTICSKCGHKERWKEGD